MRQIFIRCGVLFALVLSAIIARAAAPQPGAVMGWDTATDFDQCYRNRYLDSLSEPGAVKLTRRIVIADEMGKEYNDYQPIRGKTQARKILVLDDAGIRSAMLLIGGSVADCLILVNGTPLTGKRLEKSYWNADFERYTVPPALLKKGENTFLFIAPPGKSGSIRIENCQQPNRSAISRDGGASWDSDHLAEGGYCDGEFQVRLSLERYAPEAWIMSPVIDLATGAMAGGLPIGVEAAISDLKFTAEMPRGTAVQAFIRTGNTPDGNEEEWSVWRAWPKERARLGSARFAQWKLVLGTKAPQQTPVVRDVTLTYAARPAPAGPFAGITLAENGNERIVRSSYDYAYSDYNGNLSILRGQWKLTEAAKGDSEIARLAALRQWVREQWNDGWDIGKLRYVPSWDARVILTMAPGNLSLGMCTHYATTYVQCSSALGYTSRQIFVGHALSETWSNEYKKWVVMDAGMDPNKRRRATYHVERNGIPLNEMDIHKACFIEKKTDDIQVAATNMSAGTEQVEPAFPEKRDDFLKMSEEIFMPLRNNAIDHREPEEPEHGMGYFKFLGHLYWKDAITPEVPWTDFFTTREADLYWTLNQAQIFLHGGADRDGRIPVILDTVTPNFSGYEYRLDDGAWIAWTAGAGTPTVKAFALKLTGGCIAFPWKLHAGRNTLEARPVNKAGMKGIVSKIVLDVQ